MKISPQEEIKKIRKFIPYGVVMIICTSLQFLCALMLSFIPRATIPAIVMALWAFGLTLITGMIIVRDKADQRQWKIAAYMKQQ
jgi:hypothetical protein